MTEEWGARVVLGLQTGAIVIVGFVLAKMASAALNRVLAARASRQHAFVATRLTSYVIIGLSVAAALRHVGVDLSVLLGAAGVLSLALGFASQTSASNLISGLMLMGERPFEVGDVIRVGDKTGEVVAIDLISVKVRTFDNLLVRIPNETLLKAVLVNLTRFDIRRVDMPFRVAYGTDLDQLEKLLEKIGDELPSCLDEPKPAFSISAIGDSGIDVKLCVWCVRTNFLGVRTAMYRNMLLAFDEAGIQMALPQRVIHGASLPAEGSVAVGADESE